MNEPKLWRGQSLADRSQERRHEFLVAARTILSEQGTAAVTMRAVVRAAGLSPRYFYESFESREAVICAVYDTVEAELLARVSSVSAAEDQREAIRTVLETFRTFFEEDAGRARVLLREPMADDVLREHSSSRVPAFARSLITQLGVAPAADTDQEAWAIAVTALSGALTALYVDYADGRLVVDPERLVDLSVNLVFAARDLAVPH